MCVKESQVVIFRGAQFPEKRFPISFSVSWEGLPSLASSAVKTQEGLPAVSKGLCFRAWLRRRTVSLSKCDSAGNLGP